MEAQASSFYWLPKHTLECSNPQIHPLPLPGCTGQACFANMSNLAQLWAAASELDLLVSLHQHSPPASLLSPHKTGPES